MGTIDKENLKHTEVKTNRAKDEGYQTYHQNASQEVVDDLKTKGVELGGVEFFSHKSREDTLKASLKNYTPSMFALNSSSSKRIKNPRRYLYLLSYSTLQ